MTDDIFTIRSAPDPAAQDTVQVLMTEDMARHFERECLGANTVGVTYLAGPVYFEEGDLPTYIIGVQDA